MRDAGRPPATSAWSGLLAGSAVNAAATVAAWSVLGQQRLADAVMLYLLGVVMVSLRYGYVPSLLTAGLSALSFNFFFIPPYYSLVVADFGHGVTFAVMLVVSMVISGLTQRVRAHVQATHVLAERAQRAQLEVETERLRNALLSSVSHDLRTPLAVVTGAASALMEEDVSPSVRRELSDTIVQEADRLNRRVRNLLDMARLESGALRTGAQWHSLEEVIGSALSRVESVLVGREVLTSLPPDFGLASFDVVLVEQVLVNLLENAAKYTPGTSAITIAARMHASHAELEVADRGPGVPPEEREHIFEKFYRRGVDGRGVGLGLAICRGIVAAHGGRIWVEDRPGGGASFRLTLPLQGRAPFVASEPDLGAEDARA